MSVSHYLIHTAHIWQYLYKDWWGAIGKYLTACMHSLVMCCRICYTYATAPGVRMLHTLYIRLHNANCV